MFSGCQTPWRLCLCLFPRPVLSPLLVGPLNSITFHSYCVFIFFGAFQLFHDAISGDSMSLFFPIGCVLFVYNRNSINSISFSKALEIGRMQHDYLACLRHNWCLDEPHQLPPVLFQVNSCCHDNSLSNYPPLLPRISVAVLSLAAPLLHTWPSGPWCHIHSYV